MQGGSRLAIAYERLRLAVEAGKAVGWDWDVKSRQDLWFGDLKTVFGIPSDTYSGRVEDFSAAYIQRIEGSSGRRLQTPDEIRSNTGPNFESYDLTEPWVGSHPPASFSRGER